ncbi:MAG: hypothetical protein IKE36_04095 [Solobacterium sp.]|nr:hypothetical protein [Solobacterium sp.]
MYYGKENGSISVVNPLYPGIGTVDDLYHVLKDVWCAETCTPRMRAQWSKENFTLGQCSITAFLVQDLFGGEVYGIPLEDGNYHCFNRIDGRDIDLTSEQFPGEVLDYTHVYPQSRDAHFVKEEKYRRYLLLQKKLKEKTGGNGDD